MNICCGPSCLLHDFQPRGEAGSDTRHPLPGGRCCCPRPLPVHRSLGRLRNCPLLAGWPGSRKTPVGPQAVLRDCCEVALSVCLPQLGLL